VIYLFKRSECSQRCANEEVDRPNCDTYWCLKLSLEQMVWLSSIDAYSCVV